MRMSGSIDIDEHTIGGETLRAVAGDSVPVIEMRMLCGIEPDRPVVFGADGNVAVRINPLDCA